MKLKKIISLLLGLFIFISVGNLIYKGLSKDNIQVKVSSNDVKQHFLEQKNIEQNSQNTRIDASYFHGTARCYTCTLMEKYIRETLNSNFSKEIKDKELVFQTINVEEPNNSHYVQDYKLYTKSFILSLKNKEKEVKWLNCDKIWDLVRDEGAFKKYIKAEVKKYLGML